MTCLKNHPPKLRQSGYTLIEVIIAIAICGLLGGGVVTALYQIGSVNSIDNARVTAIKQVENAIHHLNRDIQMSQSVEADGEDYWLKLQWTTWDDNEKTQIVYTFEDGQLVRTCSVNGVTQSVTSIAQYITDVSADAPNGSAVPPEKAWNIQITACANSRLKEATETRVFNVIPRPGS